ncbi:MAG TPA: Na-translocating system protein MpsC family protein [Capillimicrobium sp.]|nr:Na-translocating system protein MpsC family protein [Capillimicrobium sp.]
MAGEHDDPPPREPGPAATDLLDGAGEAPGLGSVRSALANAMVGLKKKYYGKGPTAAKAWILDDYVFVALEGGLTRNEETLLADGKQDLVRGYRLSFEETMSETTCGAVEELTGRRVLTYQSQIVFDPVRSFEIFVLGPEAG